MSATGRGAEREAHDFYATPAFCTRRLLDEIGASMIGGRWLEPGVGSGAIVQAADAWRAERGLTQVNWTGIDVRRVGYAREVYDYTGEPYTVARGIERFSVAIGNPPFKQALRFVENALVDAHDVVMLLRVNFLEGAARASFLREQSPDVFVLPNRPSFTGKGTDATGYAWFRFGAFAEGRVRVLETTPVAERRARVEQEAAE